MFNIPKLAIIGAEDMLRRLNDFTSPPVGQYPPYNVRKINDSNSYLIELAVAGFKKEELSVEVENDKLIIKGNTETHKEDIFLFRGLAYRNFTRTFELAETIEVVGSTLVNGILSISLKNVRPAKSRRFVDIGDGECPEFLCEENAND